MTATVSLMACATGDLDDDNARSAPALAGAAPRATGPERGELQAAALTPLLPPFLPSDLEDKIDLNHDGFADVCGRSIDGIVCQLSTGSTFVASTFQTAHFRDSAGWRAPEYHATIRFPDLDADGRADVCGRAQDGIYCAMNTGTGFGPLLPWTRDFNDAAGWNLGPQYYSTISFPDVNHDGRADVCGRGGNGVVCALNTGLGFGSITFEAQLYRDAAGWSLVQHYSTIRFPDVNGDGRADVCGRAGDGMYCALSTGTGFAAATRWTSSFQDAHGWNLGPQYFATIRFPDINGDGRADLCGRGSNGVSCALSTGGSFGDLTFLAPAFSDAHGFTARQYYTTIRYADVSGDGKPDVCGRDASGIECAITGATSFTPAELWSSAFSDSQLWNLGPEYYTTIRLPDVNHDGRADVCGRSANGIFCALSVGTGFGDRHHVDRWSSLFTNQDAWNAGPEYYSTIRFP